MSVSLTDRTQAVMALADQEARRMNHAYIGTEHILLALLEERDGFGFAAVVMRNFGVELPQVRQQIARFCSPGPKASRRSSFPQRRVPGRRSSMRRLRRESWATTPWIRSTFCSACFGNMMALPQRY